MDRETSTNEFIRLSNQILQSLFNTEEQRIYHYTSYDALLPILQSKTLRFSDRFYMNDKTEGTYALDLLIRNIDDIIPVGHGFREQKREICDQCSELMEELKNDWFNIYQCSFSLDGDSLPMWNYYTKNNNLRGINIGFDSKELSDSLEKNIRRASDVSESQLFILGGQVIYDRETQIQRIKKVLDKYFEKAKENGVNHIPPHGINVILRRIVLIGTFFKMNCFEHEKEFRLAVNLSNENGELLAMKDSEIQFMMNQQGFYMPYVDVVFDLDIIKSLSLAPGYDYDFSRNNLRTILKSFGIVDVEINQSEIPVRY